ncbi:MAG: OmpA family protein [Colwellia sp.]
MIKITKRSALALLISSAVTLANASEQPKATDLVGHYYLGAHALHFEADSERLMTSDPKSYMDDGNGFGGEIGYRWLPSTEFRFSYSQFDLNSAHNGYKEPNGSSTALDLLFFPTEKNFYVITGVNNLDVGNSQISGNLGAGYRHYINQRSSVYFEGKANYQFSEHYDEVTAQIGFIYFFGDMNTSQPILTRTEKVVLLDADKDGIVDADDNCPNTPIEFKVDRKGCTLFIDDEFSIEVLVSFANDSAEIASEYFAEIQAMANFLNANPDISLTIEGHSSAPGSEAYNLKLSEKRANAILDMLVNNYQVKSSQLIAVGFGESRLLNAADTETAHAQNRRIIAQIEVTKKVEIKR